MTPAEARGILDIPTGEPLTPDSLKTAFRKAAMTAHPDKGGSVQAFLRVQAAYEFLMKTGGAGVPDGAVWTETPEELEQRLQEISQAFERIARGLGDKFGDSFNDLAQNLATGMESLDSPAKIEREWPNVVQRGWHIHCTEMNNHIRTQVEDIANAFDAWLVSEMRFSVRLAKAHFLRMFWRRPPFYLIWLGLFGISGVLLIQRASVNITDLPLMAGLGAATLGLSIASHLIYSESKFTERGFLPRMADHSSALDHGYFHYSVSGVTSTDEAAGAGLIGGAVTGAIFGGPIGAIIGGVLGGVFGSLFGTPIEEIQKKVYENTMERIVPIADGMFEDLVERITTLRNEYLKQARENYEKASRNAVGLLTSSS